jgi:hypothetical protein
MIKSDNILEKLQDAKNKYLRIKDEHDKLMSVLKEEAKNWMADDDNYTFFRALSFVECYHYKPYGFDTYDLRFQKSDAKNQCAFIFKRPRNFDSDLNQCYGFICYLENIKSTLPTTEMWLYNCKEKRYRGSLQNFIDEHSNEKIINLFESYVSSHNSPFERNVKYFDIITNKAIKVKDVVIFKTNQPFDKYRLFN